MRIVKGFTLFVFAVVLVMSAAGCTVTQQRRKVTDAQHDLVGLSRASLMNCAGEPDHVETAGDREYISFVALDPDPRQSVRSTACVASFTVRRGYVESVFYQTPAGRMVAKRETCLPIIESCLSVTN